MLTCRTSIRRVQAAIAMAAIVGCALVLATSARRVAAQDVLAPEWELLSSYAGGVLELRALPSGETVALGTDEQLVRSLDDGDSWQPVPVPPDGHAVQVDPTAPSILYGSSKAGIWKSEDGGAAWRLIYPSMDDADPFGTAQFAISPVDPRLLYFAHARGSRLLFDRSRDGGATWERTRDFTVQALCNGFTRLLVADPTDARLVFSDLGCYAGRNRGTSLLRSDDQGSSWHTIFRDGQDMDVGRLAGGGASEQSRLYLTGDAVQGVGPARLFRSDDGGAHWSAILQAEHQRAWRYGGLAVHPTSADLVWVAIGYTPDASETGVRVSSDAGQTWTFLGRQDIGWVNDLVRTADGSALLAATNEGIWRYRFATPDQPTDPAWAG
jgi:photosystem II stability/assembly factor-like uncharacterized protein